MLLFEADLLTLTAESRGLDTVVWDRKEVQGSFVKPGEAGDPGDKGGKPIGVIVGGSIGGGIGLLAIGGVACLLYHQRKRKADTPDPGGSEKSSQELDAPPQTLELDGGSDNQKARQELDGGPDHQKALPSQELEAPEYRELEGCGAVAELSAVDTVKR